jgi:hypothetical protein
MHAPPNPDMRRAALGGSGPKSQKSDRSNPKSSEPATAFQAQKSRRLSAPETAIAAAFARALERNEGARA